MVLMELVKLLMTEFYIRFQSALLLGDIDFHVFVIELFVVNIQQSPQKHGTPKYVDLTHRGKYYTGWKLQICRI